MKNNFLKISIIIFALGFVAAFFAFDLGQYLSFQYIKDQQQNFLAFYQQKPLLSLTSFFIIYVLVTSLSLPGAAVLTLAAGGLFGLGIGTILVSFASTIGATFAFLAARFILRDSIQKKFGDKLSKINDGIKKEGAFYLFTLRLIPAFPFFVINLVMGLTPLKTLTFFLVSQIGMLPGTLVYVNAGTQLAQLESLKGIFSFNIILSFAILGLFPLITKKVMSLVRRKTHA